MDKHNCPCFHYVHYENNSAILFESKVILATNCPECNQELNKVITTEAAPKSTSIGSELTAKKWYPYVLAVVVFLAAFFTTQRFLSPSVDQAMIAAASELNEGCPMMVNGETRIDNAVVLPDNAFQYNYTLVHLQKDLIQIELYGIKNELLPRIVNNEKTNPNLKFFKSNKTTMSYN